MNTTRVLVTGGTGLVGYPICEELKKYYEVVSTARSTEPALPKGLTIVTGDLAGGREIARHLLKTSPNIIVHCAAQIPNKLYPDSRQLAQNNERLDSVVFSVAQRLKCRLVYMSSTIVYGYPSAEINITETSPTKPNSFYAEQKLKSEADIIKRNIPGVVLRLNAPYGPRGNPDSVLHKFIKQAKHGHQLEIYGSGQRRQDFTHVRDIANLVHGIVTKKQGAPEIFNISAGAPITMRQLAETIKRLTGSTSPISCANRIDDQESHRASYCSRKARNHLGWKPSVSIEEGVAQIINTVQNSECAS